MYGHCFARYGYSSIKKMMRSSRARVPINSKSLSKLLNWMLSAISGDKLRSTASVIMDSSSFSSRSTAVKEMCLQSCPCMNWPPAIQDRHNKTLLLNLLVQDSQFRFPSPENIHAGPLPLKKIFNRKSFGRNAFRLIYYSILNKIIKKKYRPWRTYNKKALLRRAMSYIMGGYRTRYHT